MQALVATALFVVGAALNTVAEPPSPDKPPTGAVPKDPAVALEGAYTIVSGERDGKAIPEDEIKGSVVRFADGKVIGTDKNRKEFYAAAYTVDATKKPWKIDMKSVPPAKPDATGTTPRESVTATGLVKKEGETLTIVYALPGGDAPTEFKTKAKQQMFVMKSFVLDPPEKNKFKGP